MTVSTLDLSRGARRTVRLDTEAVRARLRPDLRDALLPTDAPPVVVAELLLMHSIYDDQISARLDGHTGVYVPQGARR